MRGAPQCFFFLILPSYHTFGDNSDCWQKSAIFSKFDLWWPMVTTIMTWPENYLSKSLRSRRGQSYAVYRSSLSSVVFVFRGGKSKKAPSARNWTFQSPPGIGLKTYLTTQLIWQSTQCLSDEMCSKVTRKNTKIMDISVDTHMRLQGQLYWSFWFLRAPKSWRSRHFSMDKFHVVGFLAEN